MSWRIMMSQVTIVYTKPITNWHLTGLSPTHLKMQLTYFDGSVTSQGDSEELAMQEAALAMLKVFICT